jgi:hypothetical protein
MFFFALLIGTLFSLIFDIHMKFFFFLYPTVWVSGGLDRLEVL